MLTVKEICKKIDLQPEMADRVVEFDSGFRYTIHEKSLTKLFDRHTWDEGREELKKTFGKDEDGVKMLTCMLHCAAKTYDNYVRLYIGENVFIDTFRCFTRFVQEHYDSYGTYGFDRDFWTPRQLALEEVRLGELEYEMVTEDGENFISVHIPSDAVMKKEKLRESYKQAKDFFRIYFPAFADVKLICNSWLLSPFLKGVLPAGSNILEFQKSFTIGDVEPDSMEFVQWVFKNPKLALEDFPEDTSLQRSLKAYLKEGGKVGEAKGILVKEPFV